MKITGLEVKKMHKNLQYNSQSAKISFEKKLELKKKSKIKESNNFIWEYKQNQHKEQKRHGEKKMLGI